MESIKIDYTRPIRKAKAFLSGLRKKENPIYRTLLMMLGSNPMWTTKDIAKLAEAGYQNCSTAYACVNLIVEAAAGVPWMLFRKPVSSNGKKEKIEEHDLLTRLHRPNPQDGGAAFIKNALAYYLVAGNSYLIKVGPERGPPRELYTMRPDRVVVLPGTKFEPIGGYRYRAGGNHKDFGVNEVLHLKAFAPLDDWYGLSPLSVASKEIDISSMGREWNMRLLQHDARPPGALTTEGSLEEEQRTSLKKQMREDVQGYENAGMPLVFEGGLKWESFAITPKDMDWTNSDKLNSRKICSVFKVAPELIGDAEKKTYSNYAEARKALYMESVLPLLSYLRDEFNNWLTPAWGDERLYLEYDRDAIEALREELGAVYTRMAQAHWLTVNEKRMACGKGEIKGGDEILIPSTLIPLNDISGNIKEE